MANKKSVIGAELKLDKRGFTKDLNSSVKDAQGAVSSLGSIRSPFGGVTSGIERLGKSYQGIKGVVGDVINIVKGPLAIHADYQDMRDKLTAIEGSAITASESLGFLAAISDSQAMDLEPLVDAHSRLVSLGYSAGQSRDMIRELANAAESAGAGSEVLEPIIGSLEKIDEKGGASVKQLMAFGQTLPVLRQILDQQFGVKTAADLEKLDLSSQQVFDGLLAGLKQVDTATASTEERALAADALAKIRLNPDAEKPSALSDRVVVAENPEARAARLAKLQGDAAAARDSAAAAIFEKESAIADLEIKLAQAEESKDEKAIAAAAEKLAIARDLDKVMKDTGASEQLATDAIKAKVQQERQLAGIKSAKGIGGVQEDLAVSTLRASGKTKQADKLEAKITQKRREKELIDQGASPQMAGDIAKQERKNAESESRFQQTGRRRIQGAKSKTDATSFTGIDGALKDPAITYDTFEQTGGKAGGYDTKSRITGAGARKAATAPEDRKTSSTDTRMDLKPVVNKLSEILGALQKQSGSVSSQMAPA